MKRSRFLLWILMLLLIVQSCCIQPNINTDRDALVALKSQIISGPQNILATNWSTSSNSNTCNWVGVTCGVSHLRVTTLDLSFMSLSGTIPPHLGNLSFLVELNLRNNSFHGTLPQELSHLRRLKLINLAFNNFMGTIPSWFGSLSKLQTFNLRDNQFYGSIHSAIFNFSALESINLINNQLSGTIPREIGNLTMLKEIYLDDNKFKEIPKEMGTLDHVEKLYVQRNALEGPFPIGVLNMSSLTSLTLFSNKLKGSIPENICQYRPSIQGLNLGRNMFDGPLPSSLWQCKELVRLELGGNYLSGSIPKNMGNLTHLTVLFFAENKLTGSIPDEIGHIQNLQVLALHSNNLHGLIPSTIFNISMMAQISLHDNQLSGSLPANIGLRFPNLRGLYLGNNKLSGLIPSFISHNGGSKLTDLDMGGNSFGGYIPSTFCSLTNLERLYLFQNNLTIDPSPSQVNILSCLPNFTSLTSLALYDNPLDTTLPLSFGNLSKTLEYLDLQNCHLKGNIPDEFGNLSSLIGLSLAQNQLSGLIPTSVGRLRNLQLLYLSMNKLKGYIPSQLCQLDKLADIRLEYNQLSGSIPYCMANLSSSVRILILQSNLFTSTIPSTLWGLQDILYLDLSSNLLNGSLPEDIGKLKVVIEVNLSNNHLTGPIPSSIGGLKDLVNLSLENNNLQGPIPSSCGGLISLEYLDLSKNNLVDMIPKSLEALSHLKYLNLSSNKLAGEIPSGGPFKNFSSKAFVFNGPLCGAARFRVPPCKKSTHLELNWRKAKYIIPAIISVILIAASVSIFIIRRKKNVKGTTETPLLSQLLRKRVSHLQLLRATDGFNETNLLGSGGFGSVYKGTISDGTEVAVKVFNLQVERAFKSFDSECQVLSNIRHRNLIKIISCCSELEFKALVLQYMPNGSLEKWLYSHNYFLNILQRLDIMIDVAKALEYLHHGHDYSSHVVHCDMKPSNILLDADMVAHVADFGIAKLLGGGDSMVQTMTLATVGYMAPEFGMEGMVSTRGDVYSFGIVLMETFTRRKPTDDMFVGEMSLKQWIANSLDRDTDAFVDVVDANLLRLTEEDREFVNKMDCLSSIMRLALACSSDIPEERINMQDAVVTLNKIKIKYLKDSGAMRMRS